MLAGETGTFKLLLLSQVILSMQLPFAVIPLIHFTNDKQRMGAFANRVWLKTLAWLAAALILALNVWLVILSTRDWLNDAASWRGRLELGMIPILTAWPCCCSG
jgi:manganese transport protein